MRRNSKIASCLLAYGLVAFWGRVWASPNASGDVGVGDAQGVEGVFLSPHEQVSLYFSFASGPDGDSFRRRAEFVWTDPEGSFTRVYEDVAQGKPWLGAMPAAPAGMPVESLSDGSLMLTFPAPPGWENRMGATTVRADPGNDRPRVADESSARLLIVAQFDGVNPQRGSHDASLYGTKAHIDGVVWLRKVDAASIATKSYALTSSSWVVWLEGEEMRAQQLVAESASLGHHFILAVTTACEASIPQSLLLTMPEPARLVSNSGAACFSSGKSVSPTKGLRLRGGEVDDIRGLLIWK